MSSGGSLYWVLILVVISEEDLSAGGYVIGLSSFSVTRTHAATHSQEELYTFNVRPMYGVRLGERTEMLTCYRCVMVGFGLNPVKREGLHIGKKLRVLPDWGKLGTGCITEVGR
jgi:hypothetical protein